MNALLCCPKTRSVGVQTDPEFPFSCFPVAHLQWQHKCQPEETQLGAQPQREREKEREHERRNEQRRAQHCQLGQGNPHVT